MRLAGWFLLFVFSPLLAAVACVVLTIIVVPSAPVLLALWLSYQQRMKRMREVVLRAKQVARPVHNPIHN